MKKDLPLLSLSTVSSLIDIQCEPPFPFHVNDEDLLLAFSLSVYITGKPNYKPEFSVQYKPISYLFSLSWQM
jgi:hypothetical protein